jgi:CMP-N-acetylneuraminic acid synthetase
MLAIIPARRGSRRLPGKNTRTFIDKPLILWTIKQAKRVEEFTGVVVTTDDPAVQAICRDHNVRYIERPKELAADDSPMWWAVEHVCYSQRWFGPICLLQPTSPNRTLKQIHGAIDIFNETGNNVTTVWKEGKSNGSIYIRNFHRWDWLGKEIMDAETPDIDTQHDWDLAETYMRNKLAAPPHRASEAH